MITEILDKEKCCGCSSCNNICPMHCINMKQEQDGFLYPSVDSDKCIRCGKCNMVCPVLNKHDLPVEAAEKSYAGYCPDKSIREKSSSGGLFFVLAERILLLGGVIIGAAFDDTNEIIHVSSRTVKELKNLQGAKYVQSNMNNCFGAVCEELRNGKWVLFSGTACQISGLKKFLKHDYEKLITIDIICHGVLSPLIWKKYITEIEKNNKYRVIDASFRNKKYGWHNYSMAMKLENGVELIAPRNESVLLKIYNSNLGLRLSCYDCQFKGIERDADITLGDFWGIENVMPEMDDGRGCSCIITHSQKGERLLQEISDKLVLKEVPIEHIIAFNSSLR